MYLKSIATANPKNAYSQADCWELIQRSEARNRLKDRSLGLLRKILNADNGIRRRHFAIPEIEHIFDLSPDQLNEKFRQLAPGLAGDALSAALDRAGLKSDDLDALFVCTCTGYLCPGLSSYVSEALGLRPNAYLQDVVGQGCGAAIPTLRSAQGFLAANPGTHIACIAVEICSAAFYLDDDPGVIISACLFADGAAATIWQSEQNGSHMQADAFHTLHIPEDRELLRFETRDGKLRNLLHKTVPEKAARAVARLFESDSGGPVSEILTHPGGRDVINALEAVFPEYPQTSSRQVLEECGNMSSPSVLFTLRNYLDSENTADGDIWLTAFGAGFSAHSFRLRPV